MTVELVVFLSLYAVAFLGPIAAFLVLKNRKIDKVLLIGGAFASVVVMAHILYRAFFVTAYVPKPWSHEFEVIEVVVTHPLKPEFLASVAERWVPSCEFEFFHAEPGFRSPCSVGEGPRLGEFVAITGPRDEDSHLRYRVDDPVGLYYDGEDEVLVGVLTGGCVVAPMPLALTDTSTPSVESDVAMIWGHELAHACGYSHAIGDPTSEDIRMHLMSKTVRVMGSNTEGMSLSAMDSYLPEIRR